jgi:hypothetical protein
MRGQLDEMKADSSETSKQFQVQLGHFDASIGVSQMQLGKLDASIAQASRLATATEKANTNVLAADRPWIGLGLSVNDFQVGKSPQFTISLTNSGRRPAKITSSGYGCHIYESFPKSPDFERDNPDMYSTGIVVPGMTGNGSEYVWKEHAMNQSTLDLLNAGAQKLYCYVDLEYSDVRTGEPHFTHGCVRYVPPTRSYLSMFQSCHEYNDAK